jgi:hypothetical protein
LVSKTINKRLFKSLTVILPCLGVFLFFHFLLAYIPYPLDSDIFFHSRIGDEYKKYGIIPFLDFTQDSITSIYYFDTSLLFHQILRFIPIQEWRILANPFLFSFTILLFIQLTEKSKTSLIHTISIQTGILIFFLLISYPFLGRFLFLKGLVLFLPILFSFVYFFEKKFTFPVGLFSFLGVWTYPLFPIIILISLFRYIEISIREKSIFNSYGKLFFASFIGIFIGILFLPQSYYAYSFFRVEWWLQIFPPPEVEKISEWHAPGYFLWIKTFYLLIPISIYIFSRQLITYHLLFLLGLMITWNTTKAIEWTVPLGLLSMVTSYKFQEIRELIFWDKRKLVYLGIILFLQWNLFSIDLTYYRQRNEFTRIQTAEQLCDHSGEKLKIFLHWDDFPEFSKYCRKGIYPFGMNPLYAHEFHKQRYEMIRRFWEDQNINSGGIPIYLGYDFLVVRLSPRFKHITTSLELDSNWKQLFSNERYLVYKRETKNIQQSGK